MVILTTNGDTMDTTRWATGAAGGGFLAAMATYGTGSAMVESTLSSPEYLLEVADAETGLVPAALLMLANSAVVVGIGLFLLPILRRHSPTIAYAYLSTRIVEGVLLAIGVVFVLLVVPIGEAYASAGGDAAALETLGTVAVRGNDVAYQVAMLALGVGSLPFCYLLYRSRLVPRLLAALGFVGYVVLAAGAVLELLGVEVGLLSYVPGGIFELTFGLWLLVRGLDAGAVDPQPAEAAASEAD